MTKNTFFNSGVSNGNLLLKGEKQATEGCSNFPQMESPPVHASTLTLDVVKFADDVWDCLVLACLCGR